MHFGEHVMIDGYDGSPSLLDDKKLVRDALDELTSLLKMYQLSKPVVYHAPDNHMKDPGGWSAFVVVAESHIALHTFPRRRFLSADVYTCKNGMDPDFIADYFRKKFKLEDVEVNFVKRGKRYPLRNLI
jgi:S-adenosylmethionine decarboxylase